MTPEKAPCRLSGKLRSCKESQHSAAFFCSRKQPQQNAATPYSGDMKLYQESKDIRSSQHSAAFFCSRKQPQQNAATPYSGVFLVRRLGLFDRAVSGPLVILAAGNGFGRGEGFFNYDLRFLIGLLLFFRIALHQSELDLSIFFAARVFRGIFLRSLQLSLAG